jgi:hypothetical protein
VLRNIGLGHNRVIGYSRPAGIETEIKCNMVDEFTEVGQT